MSGSPINGPIDTRPTVTSVSRTGGPAKAAPAIRSIHRVEPGQVPADGGKRIPPAGAPVSRSEDGRLRQAVSRFQDYVQQARRDLEFTLDEKSGRQVIKVIDSQTKEVIRQIPPEELLAIARSFAADRDARLLDLEA